MKEVVAFINLDPSGCLPVFFPPIPYLDPNPLKPNRRTERAAHPFPAAHRSFLNTVVAICSLAFAVLPPQPPCLLSLPPSLPPLSVGGISRGHSTLEALIARSNLECALLSLSLALSRSLCTQSGGTASPSGADKAIRGRRRWREEKSRVIWHPTHHCGRPGWREYNTSSCRFN